MYTYVQRPGCNKENTATYVYIRAGSRTPTQAYVRPGLAYMAGSERRNNVVVVFMGRQRNASCSSGGNGTCGTQPARTEQPMETRPGVPQNGGNGLVFDRPRSKRDPIHWEGSGIPQNGGNEPPTVKTRVLLIGRGLAYRKTDKTDLCWSATVETGVLFIGRGVVYRKTGLHGILFISTVDCLHGLLFIHYRPPPASTCDCSSTGSCSSSLHRALLHRLLFNQPSPRAPVQPPLHGLLFIQPSTGYYSTSPPPAIVQPALHGVMFIQPSMGSCSSSPNRLDRSGSCSSRGNTTGSCSSTPTGNCSSKPPSNAHCSSRGSIDRLQLAAVAKESLDRVQLTAIDRSLGFSNA